MEQVLVNGIYLGCQYALIALGLTLIFGLMGVLNFAHGQMYVLGGFVTYYVYGVLGLPFPLALVATAATLCVTGALFDKFFFRRVLRHGAREESSMLVAAGTALLLESLILIFFGEKHRGVPSLAPGVARIGDAFLPYSRIVVMALAAALIVGFIVFMRQTRMGRGLRAIAQDREAALLQGVNVERYGMLGFAIGAALAGLAGSLLVVISGVNSGLGTSISIKAFIMVMIGGAGVVSGAILGGFILGMAESLGYRFFPGGETYLMLFLVIIVFLAIRPQGLMGKPWG